LDEKSAEGPRVTPRLHKENIAGRQMLMIEIGASAASQKKLGIILSAKD